MAWVSAELAVSGSCECLPASRAHGWPGSVGKALQPPGDIPSVSLSGVRWAASPWFMFSQIFFSKQSTPKRTIRKVPDQAAQQFTEANLPQGTVYNWPNLARCFRSARGIHGQFGWPFYSTQFTSEFAKHQTNAAKFTRQLRNIRPW